MLKYGFEQIQAQGSRQCRDIDRYRTSDRDRDIVDSYYKDPDEGVV